MPHQSRESRITELLVVWEHRKKEGTPVTPEQLCSDCPELIDEVVRRIRLLEGVDAEFRIGTTQVQTTSEYPTLPPDSGPGAAAVAASAGVRYRPISFHARGGLGEVHRARDEELRREVALKRIQPKKNEGEEGEKKGTVVGSLTAKGKEAIEVKADGEEKARRYFFHFGGSKELHDALKEAPVGSRVRLEWMFQERPRVLKMEVLKAAEKAK